MTNPFPQLENIKGFLHDDEALRLYELAKDASRMGPCLEIGSYCGKSGVCLGYGCRENGAVLFSVDHHRGSEEQQPGQAYFDPDLLDEQTGKIDTFRHFRQTIADYALADTIIPIVSSSATAAREWKTPLSLVFIDGSHSFEGVYSDYEAWRPHLMPEGFLLFHDIFSDPSQGGQAPYEVFKIACRSGFFHEKPMVRSLGILKKIRRDV